MNYEDMSDFEVNKLVSNFIDLIFTFNDTDETVYICEKDGAWDMVPISYFDPCNNPSDAWPIIVENEIRLDPRRTIKKLPWMASVGDQVYSTDKNPLRAAMICFLKMKDANNG